MVMTIPTKIESKNEFPCPLRRMFSYSYMGFCEDSGHECELDMGMSCPTYDEILKEELSESVEALPQVQYKINIKESEWK